MSDFSPRRGVRHSPPLIFPLFHCATPPDASAVEKEDKTASEKQKPPRIDISRVS